MHVAERPQTWQAAHTALVSGRSRRRRRQTLSCALSRLSTATVTGKRATYTVLQLLGAGATAHTYAARVTELVEEDTGASLLAPLSVGDHVAVKVVTLRDGWRTLELFEREARALRAVRHDAVPFFVDSFELDEKENRVYCLVQQLAPGRSLEHWIVEEAWRPDEAMVLFVVERLLDCLTHLHALRPPLVHRDLNPRNVLLDIASRTVSLTDFGSVGGTSLDVSATVVGSIGYMAPEQFRGQAVPASDLYGVAATALFMLSGRPPSELPQRGLAVEWRSAVTVESPKLQALLGKLLAVDPEDRGSAAGALHLLRTGSVLPAEQRRLARPQISTQRTAPNGPSVMRIQRDGAQSLEIYIPPLVRHPGGGISAASKAAFSAAWFAALTPMLAAPVSVAGMAIGAVFYGAGGLIATDALQSLLISATLRMDSETWSLRYNLLDKRAMRTRSGSMRDVAGARECITPGRSDRDAEPQMYAALVNNDGEELLPFGKGMQGREVHRLAAEVNAFMRDVCSASGREWTHPDETQYLS